MSRKTPDASEGKQRAAFATLSSPASFLSLSLYEKFLLLQGPLSHLQGSVVPQIHGLGHMRNSKVPFFAMELLDQLPEDTGGMAPWHSWRITMLTPPPPMHEHLYRGKVGQDPSFWCLPALISKLALLDILPYEGQRSEIQTIEHGLFQLLHG